MIKIRLYMALFIFIFSRLTRCLDRTRNEVRYKLFDMPKVNKKIIYILFNVMIYVAISFLSLNVYYSGP